MTTSIREEAARVAMVSALANGKTVAEANLAAQEAARTVFPLPPQQEPVELTDNELRLVDFNDLSAAEADRLDELEAQDEREFQAALDATLPKGEPTITIIELVVPSDLDTRGFVMPGDFGDEKSDGIEFDDGGPYNEAMSEDERRFNPAYDEDGELGRALHTAADMAAEFAEAQRDALATLAGIDDTPPEVRADGLAGFMREMQAEATKEVEAHNKGEDQFDGTDHRNEPRDCDIPATLRAIDIPATEHNGAIQEWFFTDAEMRVYLAGQRRAYADENGAIIDANNDIVGMWFYAHFGRTPVS